MSKVIMLAVSLYVVVGLGVGGFTFWMLKEPPTGTVYSGWSAEEYPEESAEEATSKSVTHTYYVKDSKGNRADVHIYADEHLRTDPNSKCEDNLHSLPDC